MTKQYIKSIDIKGYRNLRDTKRQFSQGINIVYGENAQGKTNFIEAVWLLSGGKSFRGSRDSEMIGFEKEDFRIEGVIEDEGNDRNIVIACSKKNPKFSTRMAKVDNSEFVAPSRIAGNFYSVIFSPVHLNIVSGGPALRRKFMDACLCQLYPSFMDSYREYTGMLNQRNNLLKKLNLYDESQQEAIFAVVNTRLAQSGCKIYEGRREFVDFVSRKAGEYYSSISGGKEKLEIRYNGTARTVDEFYDLFNRNIERDKIIGYTSAGIHREDLEIYLDGRPAKDYASQGQQRSIVIALKLAESDIMEKVTEIAPVILLDDVLSELDFGRQDYLLNNISDKQVFITSCDTARIQKSDSKKFYVENGQVTECT